MRTGKNIPNPHLRRIFRTVPVEAAGKGDGRGGEKPQEVEIQ